MLISVDQTYWSTQKSHYFKIHSYLSTHFVPGYFHSSWCHLYTYRLFFYGILVSFTQSTREKTQPVPSMGSIFFSCKLTKSPWIPLISLILNPLRQNRKKTLIPPNFSPAASFSFYKTTSIFFCVAQLCATPLRNQNQNWPPRTTRPKTAPRMCRVVQLLKTYL